MAETFAVRAWLAQRREAADMQVMPGALAGSREWRLQEGAIRHVSGRFFRVVGLRWRKEGAEWQQPFIEQREVGTLGFLARQVEGGLAFLVHAKAEPGNVGIAQIAPTCQATASNRDRVHGGEAPPYVGQFDDRHGVPLADSTQSEQGSRFLGKFNRNITLLTEAEVPVGEDHRWVTFEALRPLLLEDFLVNTDARSVICTTPWERLVGDVPFSGEDALSFALRRSFLAPVREDVLAQVMVALRHSRLSAEPATLCPIERLSGWHFDRNRAVTLTDGRLALHHIEVRAASREVSTWDQPILTSCAEQSVDLDCRCDEETLRFGFRAVWEPGLGAGTELAPTRIGGEASAGATLLQVRQSDEGGRFLRDVAKYRVRDVTGEVQDSALLWLSLSEIHWLLPRGHFNNEARSAISLLLSLA